MRLIMMGTGPFAVPTFRSLMNSNHEVVALFTRPIEDGGKRRKTAANPMRDTAEELGMAIFDPPSVNAPEVVQQLAAYDADLFVVCDYGQILSKECLRASKLGGINLHGSLLPKYRGAAPINWAVYHGEPTLGITVILMTPRLDGGPMLVKAETELGAQETAEEIEPRLSLLGVNPVLQAIEMLESWDGEAKIGEPQDRKAVTKAPRLKKSDGLLNWSRTSNELSLQIRAFQPWPRCYTIAKISAKKELRLIINRAVPIADLTAFESSDPNVQPGQVAAANKTSLVIQTGNGFLSIERVQPSGKNDMAIADFLRGYPLQVGSEFGARE